MRVLILTCPGGDAPKGRHFEFEGARGKVRWSMDSGYGLGKAGAFNAFLRMGFHPELIAPNALPDPDSGDLLVICESGRLSAEDLQTIRRWRSDGGGVLASGASESWSELLPGVTQVTDVVANPYAGLAVLLDGGAPELVAPSRWRHFSAVTALGSKIYLELAGRLAEVSGERQTPVRALVSALPNAPALIWQGRLCLVNADPFAAFQRWLQGQENLQPWLNWRHRLRKIYLQIRKTIRSAGYFHHDIKIVEHASIVNCIADRGRALHYGCDRGAIPRLPDGRTRP